ncbi:MAG: replicative DNA helicase, partial [bacterium]
VSKVATSAHIDHHAYIIIQQYVRRKVALFAQRLKEKAFDDSVDINDLMSQMNKGVMEVTDITEQGRGTKTWAEFIEESIDELLNREEKAKSGKVNGIKTPLSDLTKLTSGWQDSDLIILAGRPGMGKTAFALETIGKAVKDDKWPCLFSLEMSGRRLVDRVLIAESKVNAEKFASGYISVEEMEKIKEAAERLKQRKVIIDDRPALTFEQIRSKAIKMKKENKCDLVIIDYIGLVDASKMKKGSREQEVAAVSANSKALAKELNIPVIVLSQLNRRVEERSDKRPRLSDLRESGGIEQDADVVMFLYRASEYGEGEPDEGEVIVAKHRNGKKGKIHFKHNESMTRIYDYINYDPQTPF